MKPFASRRFFNSCAAKRSPFVGKFVVKPLSTSGAESQVSLTCDLTSLICVSIDFGILDIIWSKMRDGKARIREVMWVCLQYVYAVSKMFDITLKSCKVSAF